VDIVGWQGVPDKWADHPRHAHNRLITSIVLNTEERQEVARAHCAQLATAKAPVALLLPQRGCGEWDREGADLHDKDGLAAFLNEIQAHLPANVQAHRIDGHINDEIFARTALEIFDTWCAAGVVSGA